MTSDTGLQLLYPLHGWTETKEAAAAAAAVVTLSQ